MKQTGSAIPAICVHGRELGPFYHDLWHKYKVLCFSRKIGMSERAVVHKNLGHVTMVTMKTQF